MIDCIELLNFQDSVICTSELYQSKESFLQVNCKLKKGNVYGLISDFGCGSWGLTTCLGGRCSPNYTGNVFLNGTKIQAQTLQEYSCFVAENNFKFLGCNEEVLTPKLCIEKALSLGTVTYTSAQLKRIFCLSDGRFERPIEYSSGEIWLISMAVNFALSKEIFCYPWLNMIDISRFEIAIKHGIMKFLKSAGKIILVPSSQERTLKKYCDHVFLFDKGKILFR